MKSTHIFNGRTLIEVQIGDRVQLFNQFLNPGTEISLNVRSDITVKAQADELFGTGTFIIITDIKGQDELAEITINAEDVEVEVETMDYSDNIVSEKIQIARNLSKKNLVERITEENLDVNTKQTKAQIYAELEGLDNVELV